MLRKDDPFTTGTEEKAKWIKKQFKPIFKNIKSVLDVGCHTKWWWGKCLSREIRYISLDIAGEPDIYFDLDKGGKLPFEDNEFDLIIATDILEHLEDIHFVFDELCRVSRRYIIISLPNPFLQVISALMGRKVAYGYGLPLERPKNRHRWFYTTEQAVNFIKYRSDKNKCKVSEILYLVDFQTNFKRMLKIVFSGFSRKRMLNWFNGTVFFLIEK